MSELDLDEIEARYGRTYGPTSERFASDIRAIVAELRAAREHRIEEFAVFDDKDRLCGFRGYPTFAAAEDYLGWLTGARRDEMRRAAEAEPADLSQGNAASYHWRKEQARTYRILRRTTTPWVPIEEHD